MRKYNVYVSHSSVDMIVVMCKQLMRNETCDTYLSH